MIVTLTGNLLAERTFDFVDWAAGRTQRARAASFQVGGKGINVSKMLLRLGAPTEAWCFPGGDSGRECTEWLARQGLPHRVFASTTPTRSGFVVRAPGQAETTFLGPDAPPDATAIAQCAADVTALPADTWLAVCGSLPGWSLDIFAPLRTALTTFAAKGTLIVDTYGPPLATLSSTPARLIKINRQELDQLTGAVEIPVPERLDHLRRNAPPLAWIVTDGAGPLWLAARAHAPVRIEALRIEAVSATGSGDVLLAGLIDAWRVGGVPLADALRWALPYAAANAAHAGIAEFPMNNLPPRLSAENTRIP